VLRIAIRGDGHDRARQVVGRHDPTTRGAIQGREEVKVREINDRVRQNLRALIAQLGALDLAHGDAGALAGKLARTLGKE
jgi:hypothetical protein